MIRKRITTMILLTLLTMLPIIFVVMMYHIALCDTLSKIDSKALGDSCVLYKVSDRITKMLLALHQMLYHMQNITKKAKKME